MTWWHWRDSNTHTPSPRPREKQWRYLWAKLKLHSAYWDKEISKSRKDQTVQDSILIVSGLRDALLGHPAFHILKYFHEVSPASEGQEPEPGSTPESCPKSLWGLGLMKTIYRIALVEESLVKQSLQQAWCESRLLADTDSETTRRIHIFTSLERF